MNEQRSHLGRLFDEAIAHYQPQPDVARFERMLVVQHRRRAGIVVWSAAACFALIGGTAFAFNQQTDDNILLAPAHSGFDDHSESTTVKTTEHRPDRTLPDGGHEPIDRTTLPTLPPTTEPVVVVVEEPTTTQKKKETPKTTQPHTTEPHTTEPPNTEPPNTEPGDGVTTTTEAHYYEWSVHQVKGSTDAEPVVEVFYGTGDPNEKITIESPYGYTQLFPNDNGQWEAHITFEGAPVGVAFPIYVHTESHVASFSFTYFG